MSKKYIRYLINVGQGFYPILTCGSASCFGGLLHDDHDNGDENGPKSYWNVCASGLGFGPCFDPDGDVGENEEDDESPYDVSHRQPSKKPHPT
ncbi:hypothetical protein N7481_004398 [Penicillium waksmanii]|uniref:uncharacterized protein n=1 Tax=Penicillium waksmanii TaxID=69791 RepID=UPI00254994D2|nr:uncharacterized protein N7481_004398 [Penicillium waksmanii]KAJ5989188.1 hypothetical protein N7481_004398 [Penicillium waksmanii]